MTAEDKRRNILLYSRALTRRQVLKASAGALPLAITAATASAQAAYPARPVKVVIPYPPAGGADTVGRLLFQKLGEMWGAQFVIDNRGGAGGTIAAAAVAKAERDGYTIMYDATAHSVNPSLYANLPYDTVKDFQPVFLAALVTNLLLVNKSVDVQSVADVIALAQATPGGLDWPPRATARCSTARSKCSSIAPASSSITSPTAAAARCSTISSAAR